MSETESVVLMCEHVHCKSVAVVHMTSDSGSYDYCYCAEHAKVHMPAAEIFGFDVEDISR